MSSFEHLSITLEHDIDEQYQYQPGEIVRGHIHLTTVRPAFIKSIYITIIGEGSVGWEDETTQQAFTAEETYVNVSKVIVDTKDTKPLSIIKGRHEFPFEYQLPENLPSSYIGKFGSITYLLKATTHGNRTSDHAITSEPFLVLRRSVLPSSVEKVLTMENEKRLVSLCSFGKISVKVSVNKQGGIPGEDLFIHAEIKNKTRRTITAIQGAIVMDSKYHASNQSTSFRQIVNKKRDEVDVGYNEARRWSCVRLAVPPYIPESKLEFCDIIDLTYTFQFRVELTGGTEIILQAPLIIGALPAGLEFPDSKERGHKINSQWTVRSKGIMYDEDDGVVHLRNNNDHDAHDEWNAGVPELRPDYSVVKNPLFRKESFITTVGQRKYTSTESVEIMENTRL
ncbi:arrestin domain-containing protein 4-like [Gigantopelta aegis]|uniref:arrestin domain-containing protein 4-like n=1 Tax=Gigantopelta aegis TaxID=1735272 RepID=UPI001B88E1C2|nr:arrestin domain-containing protein 4-like [Gigantopelta aegis]